VRCNLTRVRSQTLGDEHPIVEAQRVVSEIIASKVATFSIFASMHYSSVGSTGADQKCRQPDFELCVDPRVRSSAARGLKEGLHNDFVASKPSQARSTLNNSAPARAVDTAIGVSAALDVLSLQDVTRAGVSARWIVDGQNANTAPADLRSCGRDGPLSAVIAIGARRPALGPELQLRYRAAVSMPCAPDLDLPCATSIAASFAGRALA